MASSWSGSMAVEWNAMFPGMRRFCSPRRRSSSMTGPSADSLPQTTVLAGAFSQAISTWGALTFPDRQITEEALHAGAVQADRQHAAGAGHTLLQGGAVVDQSGRLGEGKRPAGIGGGHFARAVSDDTAGMDTPCRQQLHQGALDHEDRGLGQLDFVQLLLPGRETGIAQRDFRVAPPLLLHGVDNAAEDGVGIVERTPATRPLRALPREHHGNPALTLLHAGNR